MGMKAFPPQLIKEAEQLKSSLAGENVFSISAYKKRNELCAIYQTLLLADLDFALDKKIEQELWNIAFRSVIQSIQRSIKEKRGSRNLQSKLGFLLEYASGFYSRLFQRLCYVFELDFSSKELHGLKYSFKEKCDIIVNQPPRKASVLYICQDCLVHMGDLARYKSQSLEAENFYRQALKIHCSNGQPYNQLALLEAASGRKLSSIFYYMRSNAVCYPFGASATNMNILFSKMCLEGAHLENDVNSFSVVSFFLQIQASIHLGIGKEYFNSALAYLNIKMSSEIVAEKLETWQMVQMVAMCMFALDHLYSRLPSCGPPKENLTSEEKITSDIILELMGTMLQNFLMPLQASVSPRDARRYFCNAPIKLLLDWILQKPSFLVMSPFIRRLPLWQGFCELLKQLEYLIPSDSIKDDGTPLPEDWELQGFLPLSKAHKKLDFCSTKVLSQLEADYLRATRLLEIGRWIANRNIEGKTIIQRSSDGVYIAVRAEITDEMIRTMDNLSLKSKDLSKDKRSRGYEQVRFSMKEDKKVAAPNPDNFWYSQNVALQGIMQQNQQKAKVTLEKSPVKVAQHSTPPPPVENWYQNLSSMNNGSTSYRAPLPAYNNPPVPQNNPLQPSVDASSSVTSWASFQAPQEQMQDNTEYTALKEWLRDSKEVRANSTTANTYSLFNSTWSSGLNIPSNGVNAYYDSNIIPQAKFDLWAGGKSPLLNLLEKQKHRNLT